MPVHLDEVVNNSSSKSATRGDGRLGGRETWALDRAWWFGGERGVEFGLAGLEFDRVRFVFEGDAEAGCGGVGFL
ncbi:MAG: hypothetical protein ACRD0U_00520 [Acidimicrobiales bacterium]